MVNDTELERYTSLVRNDLDLSSEMSEEEVYKLIAEKIFNETQNEPISLGDKESLVRIIFDSIRRLDIIQELIDDEEVTEIMVNGYDHIFMEKRGRVSEWNKRFTSKNKLEDVIQQIVSSCNRVVNESDPIVDARLSDGARVNVVLAPPAVYGPILTIRRFPKEGFTLEKMIENDSLSREAAEFLKEVICAGYNCFVSGGTSSGKTTMLNVLSECIPENERVITIEDSAELQIQSIKNLVKLETKNSNSSGCKPITIRDLIKTSLRMRPDRIVVGEVRGGEVVDMLQAFNTGHEGSMSTGHANSAKDMITRLEAMYLQAMDIPLEAVKRQIASGIDILIHLERGRDGKRRVKEIDEITGVKNGEIELRELFIQEYCKGKYSLVRKNKLLDEEKLKKIHEKSFQKNDN